MSLHDYMQTGKGGAPDRCGWTTTLRMVNRLVDPTPGTVSLGGRDVRELPGYQGNLLLHFDPKATASDSDALQQALTAKLP